MAKELPDPQIERFDNKNFVQLRQNGNLDEKPCMAATFYKSADPLGPQFAQIELLFDDPDGTLFASMDSESLKHIEHTGVHKPVQRETRFAFDTPISMATGLKAIFKRQQIEPDAEGNPVPVRPVVSQEMQQAILLECPDILLSAATLERDI